MNAESFLHTKLPLTAFLTLLNHFVGLVIAKHEAYILKFCRANEILDDFKFALPKNCRYRVTPNPGK